MSDPYVSGFDSLMARFRMEFAVTRPTAHAKISGITGDGGPPVPAGWAFNLETGLVGRVWGGEWYPPLWTRHMAGVREAERAKRRRRT